MQASAALLLLLWLTSAAGAASKRRPQSQNPNTEPDVKLEQAEASALAVGQAQCEPIETNMCERMPYNSTRMPNFFGDANQFEARQRSLDYLALVRSHCSPDIETYLCELLNPICMESSRHFEIYPCRSFCRRLLADCKHLIAGRPQLAKAFQCEKLPFESNAGDGKLTGPCHEEESSAAGRRPSGGYLPYQPKFEYNKPPIITDLSPLDGSLIRPPLPPPPPPQQTPPPSTANDGTSSSQPPGGNQTSTLGEQLAAFGSNLVLVLARYSNQLSVATLICLLLVLNLRRLRRWTQQPAQRPSTGAGKQLAGSTFAASHQPAAGAQTRSASPSSSSRSLVLYAGAGPKNSTSHHHHHHHKLLDQHPEPQRIVHGLNQKTLINLNGTLERQHRYLVMGQQQHQQQADKQRLFDTLDSHSSCHSNQYDYIQVQHPSQSPAARRPGGQQQQQQLYSNILLSSPSHQVLLVGGAGVAHQNQGQHQPRPYPRPPDGAQALRTAPAELQQQRSFQRRRTMSRAPGSSWSSSSGASSSSPPDASSCGRRGPPAQL